MGDRAASEAPSLNPRPRRPPLGREDRVDQLALPLALHEGVLDEVGLAAHAEPLQDACRRGVAGIERAGHAVQAEVVERDAQQRPSHLGRIAETLMVGVHDVADLALQMLLALEAQHDVADDLARLDRLGGHRQEVALRADRRRRDLQLEAVPYLVAAARRPTGGTGSRRPSTGTRTARRDRRSRTAGAAAARSRSARGTRRVG